MVSIIIPVYNAEQNIANVINRLLTQLDFDAGDEIIIVDNGSDDKTAQIVQKYDEVILLKERNHLNSPYSCRNRGIEYAKGEYLIFLDATCPPSKSWLGNFRNCLNQGDYDLIGGDVQFLISDKSSIGELADAVNNVNMELSVNAGHAMTANLLVRKTVFKELGNFPEGIRSGGDVRWTKKATDAGYNLGFCKEAVVFKQPRTFKNLLKKSWRVGKWQPFVWHDHDSFVNSFLKVTLKLFNPPNIFRLKRTAGTHDYDVSFLKWIGVLGIIWMSQWVQTFGAYYGLISTGGDKQ